MYAPKKGDFERPDGLIERKVRWKDLGVGMTILGNGRKWKIIESAIPAQFEYGKSLWFKMQAPQGEVVSYPPQFLTRRATLLIDPSDTTVLAATLPTGAAEAELLMETLGAREIATRDNVSGEIWCPEYAGDDQTPDDAYVHLRIAHGIDTRGLEAIEDTSERVAEKIRVHGALHSGKTPTSGGFPHRHVPEDITMIG